MKFAQLLIFILCILLPIRIHCQQSSVERRHAGGIGPYPFYMTFQTGFASTKNTFLNFTDPYSAQYKMNLEKSLVGWEWNFGVTLNSNHFFGIRKFHFSRFAVEAGYKVLARNMYDDNRLRHLTINESVFSTRLIFRCHLLYPFTFQFHLGPSLHNFYTVRDAVDEENNPTITRVRFGSGVLGEKDFKFHVVPGADFRIRLAILDPAGAGGGIGFFLEYSHLWTAGERSLDSLFTDFKLIQSPPDSKSSWDYNTWSCALIVPIAWRLIGHQ